MKKDRDGELFTMGLIKHRLTFFEGNLPTVTTPLLLLNLQIQPSLSIFWNTSPSLKTWREGWNASTQLSTMIKPKTGRIFLNWSNSGMNTESVGHVPNSFPQSCPASTILSSSRFCWQRHILQKLLKEMRTSSYHKSAHCHGGCGQCSIPDMHIHGNKKPSTNPFLCQTHTFLVTRNQAQIPYHLISQHC